MLLYRCAYVTSFSFCLAKKASQPAICSLDNVFACYEIVSFSNWEEKICYFVPLSDHHINCSPTFSWTLNTKHVFYTMFCCLFFLAILFNAGNWPVSVKRARYTHCYWCCSQRTGYSWCSNSHSLSATAFSWSKFVMCLLIDSLLKVCNFNQWKLLCRFTFIEVEEPLGLILMGVALL